MKIFCRRHVKLAKKKYYAAYFSEHHANSKKQWQMINKLLNRGQKTRPDIKLKLDDGSVLSTPLDVANRFNDYFSNIATNLKSKITNNLPPDHYKSTLGTPVVNSMFLRDTDHGEILNYIKELKNKSTADYKVNALKHLMQDHNFISQISNIINSSMQAGIFPDKLKHAKVCPIYKSGEKSNVANYRPISLLPTFSKIFEKAIHHRIIVFMATHNSLYDLQFGFRKMHSCEHALLTAQNYISNALAKKQIALLLLIDFSKAFDMIDHDILSHKLAHYGIRGNALNLLQSYLSNRTQTVTLNGKTSESRNIVYGIPQGSILGPLLFVIYINDMPNICKLIKFILYADDANIIITGNNEHEIIKKYNELTTTLSDWVDSNGLLLNVKKTNYMIFSNVNTSGLDNFQPTYNHQPIEQKSVAKFLGVLIDKNLNWIDHIKSISTKMSRNCGILYRLKGVLPQKAMLTLYHSFIQSHLNYCSTVWGLGTKNSLKTLFVCQKKAVRALMPGYVNYYYDKDTCTPPKHTKQAFKSLKILTVYSLILKNTLVSLYKVRCTPHLVPHAIRKLLSDTTPDEVDERTSQRLTIQLHSIFIKGIRLFTEVIEECKGKESPLPLINIGSFKTHLKKHLLELQALGNDEEWVYENFRLCNQVATRKSKRLMNMTKTK